MYALILVIFRFATCMGGHPHHHHVVVNAASAAAAAVPVKQHVSCLDRPTDLLKILGLLIEAILFGMFTSCMMFDQCDVINSKLTHIDRLKGLVTSGALAGITEVFGVGRVTTFNTDTYTKFRPDWLSPFAQVCFPENLRDDVMGFCRPCGVSTTKRKDTTTGASDAAGVPSSTTASAASSDVEMAAGGSNHRRPLPVSDIV